MRALAVSESQQSIRSAPLRQLSVVLRNQGLNEAADRFAYRAQVLQLKELGQWIDTVWVRILKLLAFAFSVFLDVLAGYDYRPGRSVLWYLATIIVFALGYHVFGHLSLWPPDAFVYSLTSFHGRGFFPGLKGKH